MRKIGPAGAWLIALISGCAGVHTPVYDGPASDHFDGRVFFNPEAIDGHGWRDVWRWMRTRDPGPWGEFRDADCAGAPPAAVADLRLTWVNHSTVLIQAAGVNLLTDPIWSKRASPLAFAGPRRVRPPGVCFDELPPIHGVLLSHNHYDHLDLPTLRRLRAAHDPVVYAPPGHRPVLGRAGLRKVVELDWWDDLPLAPGLRLTAVPARHWSARGPFDRNRALWAGFHLATPAGGVYFAGDTGPGEHFAAIRRRLGRPRAALLPIGAYLPHWFMKEVHLSPADAVAVHQILGARLSIGIHHATFPLGDDGETQAVEDLTRAREAAGVEAEAFRLLPFGGAVALSSHRASPQHPNVR